MYDTERLIGDESIRLLYEEDPQTYSGKLATPDSPMPPYEILVKNLRKLFIESNQPMLHLDFANMDVSLNQYVNKGLLTDTIINNNDSVKREETEILPQMAGDTEWKLVTKLEKGRPMNNPWTGTGEQGAPIVELPLHTLSDNSGTDLEIKIEADLDYDDDQWELSTELTQGSQCNNPWTGEPRDREHNNVFDDTKLHNSTVTYYPRVKMKFIVAYEGFRVELYEGINFDTLRTTVYEHSINFGESWDKSHGGDGNYYSIKIYGKVWPYQDGDNQYYVRSDDGVKVY